MGEYGVTFSKSDIDDLTEKMQYLCDNPEIVEHFKESAADYICDKYNWDSVVKETLNLYGFNTYSNIAALEKEENESLNYK